MAVRFPSASTVAVIRSLLSATAFLIVTVVVAAPDSLAASAAAISRSAWRSVKPVSMALARSSRASAISFAASVASSLAPMASAAMAAASMAPAHVRRR